MKREYDFSRGKRGAAVPTRGKTRITIYLDDEIVQRFKAESERTGKGYQTLINEVLALSKQEPPVTASQVRKIVREELEATQG
ncbi:MAG: BrnA antitoxin family protein [Gammaproteobacteria bacterium]|nr:MAG: BrnA antitoxin family protein [Gammaproteobacteria bacterium]